MCDVSEEVGIHAPEEAGSGAARRTVELKEIMPIAQALAGWRENRESHVGFVGYGKTTAGNKVLIAVDREYDPLVPRAVAQALRERGAHVDILNIDMGDPDREFDSLDEIGRAHV